MERSTFGRSVDPWCFRWGTSNGNERAPSLHSATRDNAESFIAERPVQFYCPRLAGGTMPFMRAYSTIWP